MKTFRHIILTLVIFFLFLSTALLAESQVPGTPVVQQIAGVPQEQLLAGLPGTIKIDPSMLRAKIVNLPSAFYAAWKNVKDSCNAVTAALPPLENAITNLMNKSNECQAKSYTPQDMTAAGCTSSDTVQACEGKLYNYCIGGQFWNFIQQYYDPGHQNLEKIPPSGNTALTEFGKWKPQLAY